MRYSRKELDGFSGGHAAIFVDYENLYGVIAARLNQRAYPDEYISEMLDELRRYLLEEDRARTALSVAVADFSALDGNGFYIQRSLYLQGTEPRFVPASLQQNAVELQISTDVVEVLHRRPDIGTFVLLSGNRAFLPLVNQIKRYGRQVVVASLEAAPSSETIQYAEAEYFLDAHNLLSDASRTELAGGAPAGTRSPVARNGAESAPREPVEFVAITDPIQLHTLEIIETYFGQYEEVYLTPLLRKLSELLDDREHDPKTIISTLEELGAIRLEKRRGFPYDYTVLIVESEHPDVKRVQERVMEEETEEEDRVDGEYDDDYFDEYEDDDDYPDDEDYVDEEDLPAEESYNEENLDEEPR